jgi:hypothetical protein
LVLSLSESGVALGAVMAVQAVPMIVLGAWAGARLDSLPLRGGSDRASSPEVFLAGMPYFALVVDRWALPRSGHSSWGWSWTRFRRARQQRWAWRARSCAAQSC